MGVAVGDLDTRRSWRVTRVDLSGVSSFPEEELRAALATRTRPWYRFWGPRPEFDPAAFRDDLERIRRFYESRGYYEAAISHNVIVDEEHSTVAVEISVIEGPAVIVDEVNVAVVGTRRFPPELPVKRGEVFVERTYQAGEEAVRQFYLRRSHAHVQTERRAEVNLDSHEARIWYRADPGPRSFFGPVEIRGTENVDPRIVSRELTFREGEPFAPEKILESQEKLLALDLFSMVRISPREVAGRPAVVPMEIELREREAREIRASLGYGTEDEVRGQIQWRHNNWLGGGRRFSVTARYSALAATGVAEMLQPHLLSARNRGVLTLRHDREEEETYLLNATRFIPRLERTFSRRFSGFVGYRLEYAQLDDVSDATVRALGGIRHKGLLSGPVLGLRWSSIDDLLNPGRGEVATFTINQAGDAWGGAYNFYKMISEARKYISIGWETVFASRLKIGLADTLGAGKDFPVFERFFAGGEQSVRGYGRRRLGPFSRSGDPLGGLSIVEGSLELRRLLWGNIGGAVFLDFGQISTRSFHIPVDDLKFAAGFGVGYRTPVGPLRIDIGFPFEPPRGDSSWQVHFNIGAAF